MRPFDSSPGSEREGGGSAVCAFLCRKRFCTETEPDCSKHPQLIASISSYTLAKMKIWTRGRYLWTRTVGSTVVGQAVDTLIVMVVAFGGTLSWETIGKLILSGYLGKVAYEVLMTPATYAAVGFLKRKEHVDTFDYQTDFSPFHVLQ